MADVGYIMMNFGWQGPSTWRGGALNGGLDVGAVDLVFKNATTDITVHIPEKISPAAPQTLPFTCRKYHQTEMEIQGRKFKPLDKETHPNRLEVTVEQIRNLTLKAGVFEESPNKGPMTMNPSGQITYQKQLLRSDRNVELEIPPDLELGKNYTLVVTSHNLSLSARLVAVQTIISTVSERFAEIVIKNTN